MKASIIGFSGPFLPEPSTIREEAVRDCNPEGDTSFLLVRHRLEPCL